MRRLLLLVCTLAVAMATQLAGAAPVLAAAHPQTGSQAVCGPAQPGTMTCDALRLTSNGRAVHAAVRSRIMSPAYRPSAATCSPCGYTPQQLEGAYGLPVTRGAGMTVAVVEAYNNPETASDLATFRLQSGLPACGAGCFSVVGETGSPALLPTASNAQWQTEADLDVEAVSSACPLCHILLVEADSPVNSDLMTAVQSAIASGAQVVSLSWGGPEDPSETGSGGDAILHHPGVAIVAASGDSGFAGETSPFGSQPVQYPAASPDAIAVGGTSLVISGNQRVSESVWGANAALGTQTGCSVYEPEPSWQQRVVASHGQLVPNDCTGHRGGNDISADGDPATGLEAYDAQDGGWEVLGGTSLSAPLVAGAMALAGGIPSGDVGAQSLYPAVNLDQVWDVTAGTIGAGCAYCGATPGWDFPSGWGALQGVPVNQTAPFSQLLSVAADGSEHGVGIPLPSNGTASWPGQNLVRGVALFPGGAGGYILDAWGGIHPIGNAPAVVGSGYWPGWDIARSIVLLPTATASNPGGYVLDGWGGIHAFGNAPPMTDSAFWPGWDIARSMVLLPGGQGGYVLDGWGGIHAFGNAPPMADSAFWPGWDIATSLVLQPSGQGGYVLDGLGGIHPIGTAPALGISYYNPNVIAAHVAVMLPGQATAGYIVTFDGRYHPFGSAPYIRNETTDGTWNVRAAAIA